MNQQHLLLDIEGTTCPVSFVSDVLFPFAKQELSHYIKQNWDKIPHNKPMQAAKKEWLDDCLLYTSPSPRDQRGSRMPSSA